MTMPSIVVTPPACIIHATLGDEGCRTAEISTEAMRAILADGTALVVDPRSRDQFAAGHIPGAINLDVLRERQGEAVRELVAGDTSRAIVLYCNGPACQQSRVLGDKLADAGFTAVRRYQLGISVWRALGGPTAVALSWVERVLDHDDTAVLIDVRPAEVFRTGSLPRARSMPVDDVAAGRIAVTGMPSDDFNRRVILFGRDKGEARRLAEILGERPWANVAYVEATWDELTATLMPKR